MAREYYLYVRGEKVKVSEQIYKVYWREREHEKYLEQVDRKNHLLFFFMGHISPVSCTSARDNKTTRYAGARRRLYPKTLPFDTIKVVQALL